MFELSYCTACKGRLGHLKLCLPPSLADHEDFPVEFVIADYDCPDKCGDWVEQTFPGHPQIRVIRTGLQSYFRMAHSKNVAHRRALGRFVCNLDADNAASLEFTKAWLDQLQKEPDIILQDKGSIGGGNGRVALSRANFEKLNGYDERYEAWGQDDDDLVARAVMMGLSFREPLVFPLYLEHSIALRERFMRRDIKSGYEYNQKLVRDRWRANEGIEWGKL